MNDVAFAEAMTLHETGRIAEAAALYRAILDREPDHTESLHLLGLITIEHADPNAGMALILRAMAITPGRAHHHNSLGHAYRRLGRPKDAERTYRIAAELRPDSAEIHNNLATALDDLGLHQEAVAQYRHAAELAPAVADIWYNLANALVATGASAEAEACYRKALWLRPDFAAALANYGRWLMTQGRWAEAETRLHAALRFSPADAGTWNNLGIVAQELDRPDAESFYRNALAIAPNMPDPHYNLGCLLSGQGRSEEAVASHQAAIAADPGFGPARLAVCMANLPILYRSTAEIVLCRQRYAAALDQLIAGDAGFVASAIGRSQPFFLPYQEQDDRALQAAYGQFVCRVLAESRPAVCLPPPPRPNERIRLGIVSGFFADHTLFKLFLEGWLCHLDRTRFEVIGFHTGRGADAQTARCARLCDRFVHALPASRTWPEAIGDEAPHVLLYPEVGMDPIAGRLAAMRLAPVQCVAWGQPETTGMPTIDYFLSSDRMEPPDADAYYTEHLVRLPNLGLCYTPDEPTDSYPAPGELTPDAPDTDARAIDNASETHPGPVFWSGQALYKYLPQYDWVFPRIASQLGACRFVFIAFAKSQAVTNAFRDRLGKAFAAQGQDADRHMVILPPMSQRNYIDAVRKSDIILDTIGWSGGKSTLDCLALNPAIVTCPGSFMRGRHTAAILRQIDCETTIAASLDEYVSIAVDLARNPLRRAAVRQAVQDQKHRAFNDVSYVRALEAFLSDAVGRPSQ
jgi:protein O-GlcNAc transferase